MKFKKPKTVEEALEMAREAERLRNLADGMTKAVTESLFDLRVANGVTQAEMAFGSAVSQPYLSQVEHGFRSTTPSSLVRMTETLHRHSQGASGDLARARKRGKNG